MLNLSDEELKKEAKGRGYRPEMIEKVYHLLDLLEKLMAVPYLSDRLALKGGTAINLFCTEQFPRLSVDIDLNYIGAVDRDIMQKERLELESILFDICKRNQYEFHRNPSSHAGGKAVLVYKSAGGTKGRLEIDLNYVYRIPLWEPEWRFSPSWPKSIKAKVLDIHELAAGKLSALLDRQVSRDLFDSHKLLTEWPLDTEKLRLAFTVYSAMRKQGWHEIKIDNVIFSVKDIQDKLIPVLKNSEVPGTSFPKIQPWANKLVDECKTGLSIVLPFRENEIEFLNKIQKHNEIQPELISDDKEFCNRVRLHPLLHWRKQQPKTTR